MKGNYICFLLVLFTLISVAVIILAGGTATPFELFISGFIVGALLFFSGYALVREKEKYQYENFLRRLMATTRDYSRNYLRTFGTDIPGYTRAMEDVQKFVRSEWRNG